MTELGKRRYPELSEEDIEAKRMKIHSTNKFTLKANQGAARQFKDFLKEKDKDVNFEEYGIPKLDHALSQFYLSARKEDGSFYKVTSLTNFRFSLNRYLKSPPINKKFDIRTDPAFHDSNINFLAAITELKSVGKGERNPYSPISEEDLNKMYTSGNLQPTTPRGLYNKVQFEIRMFFCRHGSSAMKDMTISTFEIVKDTETNRRFVQRSKENKCGTENSQAREVWKYVMQDIPDSPYCPVASYELYLKKLPPDSKFLWHRPKNQFQLEDSVWFSVVRVSGKSLSGFMSNLSSKCGLSKTYSNLCIRATEIVHLTRTVTALNSARMVIIPKSLPSLSADQHSGNILIQNAQKIYKRKLYDPFALQNACKSVQEGLSVYRAAITHGVPLSVLRGRTMGYVSVSENSNITSTPQIITLATQGNPVSTQTRLEQSNIQIDPEWRKQAEKVDLSSQLSNSGCVMLVPVKKIIEGQPITPVTSPLTLGITSNKPHFRPIACKTDKGEIITSSFAEPIMLVKNVINRPVTRTQQTGKTGKTSENQSMSDKTQESRINDILSTQHSLKIMAFVPDQDQSPSLETQGTGSKDTLPAQSQLQQSIPSPSGSTSRIQEPSPTGSTSQIQGPSPAGSTSQIQGPSPAGSTELSLRVTTHQHENSKRKETSYLELNEFRQSQELQEQSFNTNSEPESHTTDSDNDIAVSVPLEVEVKEEPESEEDQINRLIETDQQLQSLKSKLQKTTTQLSKKEEEFKMQQSQIGSLLQQMKIMRQNISSRQRRISELENFLSYETLQHDKKLFRYYTGYTPEEFQMLYEFIVPENSIQTEAAIQYLNNKGHGVMGLKTQLLMTLNKLRNNFTFLHLAHLHSVTEGFCRNIFRRWLKLLAEKFEHVYIWPHRDSVRSQMPEVFAIDFPNTVTILKRVQVKMGLNSLESVNSRTSAEDEIMLCNRHAILAVDPRGSVIWCSKLSKGNLSDRELFIESGLKEKLQQLVCCHWLQVGDGILADETFGISEELDELGLVFNHVAFSKNDIEEKLKRILRKERIKSHKVLIDKAYARVKKFRILTQKIPSSLTSLSDIILQVCSFLTNFQTPLL